MSLQTRYKYKLLQKEVTILTDEVSKSWFAVFNNPKEHGYIGEPNEIVDKLIEEWIKDNPTRTCAMTYCVSPEGLEHVHMVLEDVKAMRFSVIKKTFAIGMHFEATKGNKEQAENYIQKKGKWEEKGEKILYSNRHGDIKGFQGQRNDLAIIEELINQGKLPSEIMAMSLQYRKYEKIIRDAYFDKRKKETPYKRDVNVIWHVGESGSGKSYVSCKLAEEKGEDSFYLLTDYENGGMDKYNGEPILFMDEFRGQIKYNVLLTMLQGYKSQVHSRFTNCVALWNEVHITSVLPPEKVYQNMVTENKELDTIQQLKRRITTIVFHWKTRDGEYKEFALPMSEYIDYEILKHMAYTEVEGFIPPKEVNNPFIETPIQCKMVLVNELSKDIVSVDECIL